MTQQMTFMHPTRSKITALQSGLFLLLLLLLSPPLAAQSTGDVDSADVEEDWDDIDEEDPMLAPAVTGSSFLGGGTIELTSLKTTDLDPDLDQDLILVGGYGMATISNFIVGFGGTSASLDQPNEAYDRFTLTYGGLLTGYDALITDGTSLRLSLLVGGGELEMIKTRGDLAPLGRNAFLERFRSEGFYMVRPEFSIGQQFLSLFEIRASIARLHPLGGADIDDLRVWTYGLHLLVGIRG